MSQTARQAGTAGVAVFVEVIPTPTMADFA
jgi:hypothetical protein